MASLTPNAYCVRFRTKEYFKKHDYIRGLKILEMYPHIDGQMIIIDSHHLYSYSFWDNGKMLFDVLDYMVDMNTKISIEYGREHYSTLFI